MDSYGSDSLGKHSGLFKYFFINIIDRCEIKLSRSRVRAIPTPQSREQSTSLRCSLACLRCVKLHRATDDDAMTTIVSQKKG